jgi:hypothetical protein
VKSIINKKNLLFSVIVIFLLTVTITACGSGGAGGGGGGSGTQTFTSNSGGNKPLPGSPYGYEMWTEGGNNNKLIWYGPDQRGGAAFRAEWNNPNDFWGGVGNYWGNGGQFTKYKNMYATLRTQGLAEALPEIILT